MSDKLKCPVCPMCGSELVRCKTFPYFYYCNCAEYEDIECELDDCAVSVPVWEVLRRTKKQLEIARKALKQIVCADKDGKPLKGVVSCWLDMDELNKCIEQLEHKE